MNGGGIGPVQLETLRRLVDSGEAEKFYSWHSWLRLRTEVLRLDNYECQMCKARGRYRRGAIVHHVRHLDERPDLALSVRDPETGERQLVTVCKACHEELHPEQLRKAAQGAAPVAVERWD